MALAEADVQLVRENEAFAKVAIREALAFRPETYPIVIEHLSPFIGKVAEVAALVVGAFLDGAAPRSAP